MWLRRIVPTIEAKRVDIGSAEGRSLAERLRLPTLPAFVFAEGVTATDFYSQAAPLFRIEGDEYVFDMNKIGMPVGRYLIAPGNAADDIVIGAVEAPVTLVVFSDFQCQFCKDFHETTKRVSAEYGERLRVVFKHLPLPTHPQAGKAAEAAQCAAAQGKFLPYADLLFARQGEWGRGTSTARFRDYAFRVPGMDTKAFSTCLESGTFAGKVSADIQLAEEFNLYSAPSAFVNEEFVSGAAPYEDLKALIDAALAR
jgi:predicted DsbA family dithiol-disulfide isomerase